MVMAPKMMVLVLAVLIAVPIFATAVAMEPAMCLPYEISML